ncbi:MAG: hypothetical protein ACREFY_17565, partial [Acetobacteraceae bacterium]
MRLRPALMCGFAALLAAVPAAAWAASPPRGGTHGTGAPPPAGVSGVPRTLDQALAATYLQQPVLQAERAKLRATDEGVPQALAGWRPT